MLSSGVLTWQRGATDTVENARISYKSKHRTLHVYNPKICVPNRPEILIVVTLSSTNPRRNWLIGPTGGAAEDEKKRTGVSFPVDSTTGNFDSISVLSTETVDDSPVEDRDSLIGEDRELDIAEEEGEEELSAVDLLECFKSALLTAEHLHGLQQSHRDHHRAGHALQPLQLLAMDAKLRSLIAKVKKEHDDDAVDRAVYATTVYILSFFAIFVMAKQYVGDPLQCWISAEYTSSWEKYIENYCFVENTYFVNGTIPDDQTKRKTLELRYYQWIPYLLSIQALLCYAPKLIFKLLYSFSDLRVTDLVQLAYRECKQKFGAEAKIGSTIASKLIVRREVKVRLHFDWYLTAIYLLMKVLFIVALFAQLIIMNFFVAQSNMFWGWNILQGLVNGQDWRTTGLFPRVTFCDLATRDVGQSRHHTVQCVLMINMFAEKIYVFLWLWTYAMLLLFGLNLTSWIYRSLSMGSKVRFVRDALRLHHQSPQESQIRDFIRDFLRLDGVLVLRLIDSNAGYVHMADILYEVSVVNEDGCLSDFQLWRNYGGKRSNPRAFGVEPIDDFGNNEKKALI
ncbi:Innexin family-containing protein [Aphelenchoides besseyi]|nr:Innexin family-containing protein [Aphelenchoides besseyi]KAI6211366.1 Innexin family-containing protein [Aphelenchoides besseyi]